VNARDAMDAYTGPIRAALAPFHNGQPTDRDIDSLKTAIASVAATRFRFENDAAQALARSAALAAGISRRPLPQVLEMVDLHREYAQSLARMAVDLLGLEDALRTIAERHERENGFIA